MRLEELKAGTWKTLTVSVSKRFWNEFDIFCKKHSFKKSRFVRLAIEDAIKKYREELEEDE